MRGSWLALLVLVGCGVDAAPAPDPLPAGCDFSATLDGSAGSAQPTIVGPKLLGAVALCLRLDATHNHVAHFAAGTGSAPGAASPFTATLTDPAGSALREGWDVTVGQTDPHTALDLEWDAPPGVITDVILHVRAKAAPAETKISVALFEPLE